ncbi:MAG TPA: VWA domain-containing protein [Terracidiphilus sp.]|nr:VWA domain-containing protein [Terracidiphilus sp.]
MAWSQAPTPVAGPIVSVPVTITNVKEHLVADLKPENFRIYDSGKQQQISGFASETAPRSIGILVDVSGSARRYLDVEQKSVIMFLRGASANDQFFLIDFNQQPELIEDFTNLPGDIQTGLTAMHSQHGTALWDAIYAGLEKMKAARYDRKTLLVITDGIDNRSRHTDKDTLKLAQESGIEIYAIGISDPFSRFFRPDEENWEMRYLSLLCDGTGGRVLVANDLGAVIDLAEEAALEIHTKFVLSYTPTDLRRDGKWRKVKVKLNPPQGLPPLTVHARTGYYAPLQ